MKDDQPQNRRWSRLLLLVFSLLAVFFVTALIGRASAASDLAVDASLKSRLQAAAAADPSGAAEVIFRAESSRQKRIQDSVDESIYLVVSAYESSVAESLSVEASVEESVAASVEAARLYESVIASIREASRQAAAGEGQSEHESRVESSIQSSIAASIEESSREAAYQAWLAESSRAEASRQASIAESSRAEASRQAWLAESSRQASVAESSRAAATTAATTVTPTSTAVVSGQTFLFGDSRASGFSVWHFWPDSQVYWMYSQIDVHYDMGRAAAARYPAKIVFLNGVDDIIAHGNAEAARIYEEFILDFQRRSPSTRIYVGNVLPVGAAGTARYPQLGNIAGYNALLQAMCNRRGWTYVDASQSFSEADLMQDGIHFTSVWTQKWLNNLRAKVGF